VYVVIDLSADAPANAAAAIILVKDTTPSGSHNFDLRENGISQELYYQGQGECGTFVVPLDADKKLEGKIASSYTDFFVLGYILSASGKVDHLLLMGVH
jgi:hypothetical protein